MNSPMLTLCSILRNLRDIHWNSWNYFVFKVMSRFNDAQPFLQSDCLAIPFFTERTIERWKSPNLLNYLGVPFARDPVNGVSLFKYDSEKNPGCLGCCHGPCGAFITNDKEARASLHRTAGSAAGSATPGPALRGGHWGGVRLSSSQFPALSSGTLMV